MQQIRDRAALLGQRDAARQRAHVGTLEPVY
jgi:hypothetical protein